MIEISENRQNVLDRAAFLRGRIIQSFAQIEFLVTDLILRCEAMPEHRPEKQSLPYKLETKLKRLKAILERSANLTGTADGLVECIDQWGLQSENRHFMAHGFFEVTFDRIDNHMLRFRLLRAKGDGFEESTIDTNLVQMHQTEHDLTELAQQTVGIFIYIDRSGVLPARK